MSVLFHDAYYRDFVDLPKDVLDRKNFDHPDSLETELLIRHVKALKQGMVVEAPIYDFRVHRRAPETRRVEPTRVVLVEGILIFAEPELRKLFDVKIFVDTDADVRLIRRIRRDIAERAGRSRASSSSTRPRCGRCTFEFVEPSKRYADLIVPEGGENAVAMEFLFGAPRAALPRGGLRGRRPKPRRGGRRGARREGALPARRSPRRGRARPATPPSSPSRAGGRASSRCGGGGAGPSGRARGSRRSRGGSRPPRARPRRPSGGRAAGRRRPRGRARTVAVPASAAGREEVQDPVDRLGRVVRVDRRQDEVPGLGGRQDGPRRRLVAHLADEEDVGVLPEGRDEGGGEVGASVPISICSTTLRRWRCSYSTGSSIVTTWSFSSDTIRSTSAARVVVFPSRSPR